MSRALYSTPDDVNDNLDWFLAEYTRLSTKHLWLPVASHCSKRNCKDGTCPMNKEQVYAVIKHYNAIADDFYRG